MPSRTPSARTRTQLLPDDGRARAVIEGITPHVDYGRFAVKRLVGDVVVVEADCFADGHEIVACTLRYLDERAGVWSEVPMTAVGNDRWRASFTVSAPGAYRYTIAAWVDAFLSWRHDFARRVDPDDLRVALLVGIGLVAAAAARARGADRRRLSKWARDLTQTDDLDTLRERALDEALAALAAVYPDRTLQTVCPIEFPLSVDRVRAGCSAWYELFPRSWGLNGAHGTFRDCERHLPYVAGMGFDVLYLPPIHPIGRVRRKGPNNSLSAGVDDVGSPWAIGASEGGHTALHPELGTLDDFRHFVAAVRAAGLELALDVAFQCAPDHPYVETNPEWFRHRPDGSVQYAENPPKKYQDIYPFDFESAQWASLWKALRDVIGFWIDEGVRIFRVDNPHTKAFGFWEWAIADVRRAHPDVIFLAEAFTRPKVMHRLAKLGFSQSYTYFTWRNTKHELTEYFTELAAGPGREYFRPNCWPNTPDILPEALQTGGRPAFMARLVLAATLSANYGIYGAAFELLDQVPRTPGAEEYIDSEKYQLRHWPLDRADTLAPFIARINAARRDNAALQRNGGLTFAHVDNDALLAYVRQSPDAGNLVLCVVNLDPHHTQSGWVSLDLATLGLPGDRAFQVHDLLTDARYLWNGRRNFVLLDPQRVPAHVFRVRRHVRSEHDFDYFF